MDATSSFFFLRNRSVEHQIVIKFERAFSCWRCTDNDYQKYSQYKKSHKITEVKKQDKQFHVVRVIRTFGLLTTLFLRQRQLERNILKCVPLEQDNIFPHAQQINHLFCFNFRKQYIFITIYFLLNFIYLTLCRLLPKTYH